MAYQAMQFMGLHAAMVAGVGALTASHAIDTTTPIYRLADGRQNGLVTFAAVQTNPYITLDRGAGTLRAITRLLIPSGHNLATATTIQVDTDDNSGFTSATNILAAVAVSAGLINLALTSSTERYVRITFNGTSIKPELGELVYTDAKTLTRGPQPGWKDYKQINIASTRSRAGVSSKEIMGDPRRSFEFTHERLGATDDGVVAQWLSDISYGAHNFYFVPPDSGETPIWCELVGQYDRNQDRPAPIANGATYEVTFALEEFID